MIQTPIERRIWRRCFWAGVATLMLGAIVLAVFPTEGGAYPSGYGLPIIALEFAKTLEDAHHVINWSQAGWSSLKNAMGYGTLLDMPFLIIYGVFLVSFFHAARVQTGLLIYKILAAIALIAAFADGLENFFILDFLLMGPDAREEGNEAVIWHYFAQAKFMALGICGLGAGVFLLRQPRVLRKIEGLFAGAGGALTLFALTRPEQMGDMLGLGVTVSWIAMLAYAATQSFKKTPGPE